MAKVFDEIDSKLSDWLLRQPMFFVGSAPTDRDGHVNISPKGMAGTFAVLDAHRVAYLDYFGSGVETIAHLRDNGRIVIMMCAFQGPPRIVRLHGRGRVVRPDDDGYAGLRAHFAKEREHGVRSIIVVELTRIADSCGYSVPRMSYVEDRDILDLHQDRKPAQYYEDVYALERNGESIDGLPALR